MKNLKKYKGHILIGLISGILNGLFGAGGGSVVVPAMEKFLGTEEKKAHATAIGVIFMMSVVSSVFYIRGGYFDFKIWLPAAIGGVAGGMLGAKLLSKISVKWLKIIFGGVIVVTAVKMIF
ncbi:MAG: sulfite exporter TauE/SafE family protein [Clostridia bacterium]|nr:sulfite exporter TauE/SafE family protein [Clostridia bacterium]